MITASALTRLARARLADARALLQAKRYDGAVYLGGYVVEMALKARICRTLQWAAGAGAAYRLPGSAKRSDAELLLESATVLLRAL